MSGALAKRLTGIGEDDAPDRADTAWLSESVGWLALMATRDTYRADPWLWRLGEDGRARTTEDFTHHLRAALAGDLQWREHVRYSLTLFDARGFPQRWLTDAFVTLSDVVAEGFGESVGQDVRTRLDAGPALLVQLAADAGIDVHRTTRYDAGD